MEKIIVDESACIGCGFCVNTAPDIFEFNSEGLSSVKKEFNENIDQATIAAEGCPTGAIKIEKESVVQENN